MRWPADLWQAWRWRCDTDPHGVRTVARLSAAQIAQNASTKEDPVKPQEVAPSLWPGFGMGQALKRHGALKRHAPSLVNADEAEQDRFFRDHPEYGVKPRA